jgi:hemagglutinin-like protein
MLELGADQATAGDQVSVCASGSSPGGLETPVEPFGQAVADDGGAIANATQNAIGTGKRATEVSDPRLKALYAAKTAYAVNDALGAFNGADFADSAEDIQKGAAAVQVGIGASSASSKTTSYDEIARGSLIRSQGDVTIAATGGDLNIIGSEIAGKNVALAAANNLNVLSQVEKHTLKSDSKNAGGGVGVQFGTDGFGIYVEASGGNSKGRGNGLTHAESSIKADNVLTLLAGNDATIRGAQLTGDSVLAAIGGNLRIESEQDTDDYASKNMQASGKVVFGAGVSGSASYSQGKVDSHYKSVNEISGISAGSGGFDITVGGNTHLKGGVIASTADASKNILDTGTLTYEHLTNEAKYKASQIGVSASMDYDEDFTGGAGGGLSGLGFSSDKSKSETQAGIAQGQIIVRDGPEDFAGLDRSPTMDNQSLKPVFDEKKVAEQMELGQVMGAVGMRAAGDLADSMNWGEGSAERTLLHGAVAAATSALGGGNAMDGALGATAAQLAGGPILDYLANHGVDPNSEEGKTIMRLAVAALGATVGGADGGINALNGENFNRQLHEDEKALARKLAADSNGAYTVRQIEDALRMSGNTKTAETALTGLLVPIDDNMKLEDFEGWKLMTSPDGTQNYLIQDLPSTIPNGLATYITEKTGGEKSPYAWHEGNAPKTLWERPSVPWGTPVPDYIVVAGSGLGIGGALIFDTRNFALYGGPMAVAPVRPSVSTSAGWILMPMGLESEEKAQRTAKFLSGAGIGVTGCYSLCLGVNHSIGGATAVEVGVGLGTGGRPNLSNSGGSISAGATGKITP